MTDRYRTARDRGGNYLLSQMRADGGLGNLERGIADYYKAPLALLVCGHSCAAGRILNWVRQFGLLPNGDFGPRPAFAHGYYHTYYNAWLIMGAQRQGQFDLSQRGTDFLLTTWDSDSGAFFSSATERSPQTLQDVWITCGAGLAALYAGQLAEAAGVGRWLIRLRELQPDFPDRLYTVCSPVGGLCTAFSPAERARYEFVPAEPTNQYFFQPGIAAGFLAQLYKATGESAWLALAEEYLEQATIADDHHFTTYQSGKVGWAGAVLYTLTRKPAWRTLAARVGDWLVTMQAANGSWEAGENTIDFTSEMTIWLDEIDQALGSL
ncbi:MAG: hypothetical protein JWN70_1317 [Planctomycetaceae bacterium]|nr:hypothetical protein [Planctomycetaceae bacterium]